MELMPAFRCRRHSTTATSQGSPLLFPAESLNFPRPRCAEQDEPPRSHYQSADPLHLLLDPDFQLLDSAIRMCRVYRSGTACSASLRSGSGSWGTLPLRSHRFDGDYITLADCPAWLSRHYLYLRRPSSHQYLATVAYFQVERTACQLTLEMTVHNREGFRGFVTGQQADM